MTAIAWTLVGLLAACLGILSTALFQSLSKIDALGFTLGARIDQQGATLGARIDQQGATLGARIDSLGAKLDGRIDSLGGEVHALRDAIHEMDVRLTRAGG